MYVKRTLPTLFNNCVVNINNGPRPFAVVPLPDFLKIGSSAEIREVGIEILIQK